MAKSATERAKAYRERLKAKLAAPMIRLPVRIEDSNGVVLDVSRDPRGWRLTTDDVFGRVVRSVVIVL